MTDLERLDRLRSEIIDLLTEQRADIAAAEKRLSKLRKGDS